MIRYLCGVLFFFWPSIDLWAQDGTEGSGSIVFHRVALYGGVVQAFDHSADDHLLLGFRVPVWKRLHLRFQGGIRHVQPYTGMYRVGLEGDLVGYGSHRLFLSGYYGQYYRPGTSPLFDSRFSKSSVGLGLESVLYRRLGVGITYFPVGFYHGSRKDNPEKGNPSLTGAGELQLNFFILTFGL